MAITTSDAITSFFRRRVAGWRLDSASTLVLGEESEEERASSPPISFHPVDSSGADAWRDFLALSPAPVAPPDHEVDAPMDAEIGPIDVPYDPAPAAPAARVPKPKRQPKTPKEKAQAGATRVGIWQRAVIPGEGSDIDVWMPTHGPMKDNFIKDMLEVEESFKMSLKHHSNLFRFLVYTCWSIWISFNLSFISFEFDIFDDDIQCLNV